MITEKNYHSYYTGEGYLYPRNQLSFQGQMTSFKPLVTSYPVSSLHLILKEKFSLLYNMVYAEI